MADAPPLVLEFHPPHGAGAQKDCGSRMVRMPRVLPDLGDDFDWNARDFDGFRLAMLEELAARFPERNRWTPADLEVVLVETLAWALDQLSDMLDRVSAESWLETARRPESLRRLLGFIGYDAVARQAELTGRKNYSPAMLHAFWRQNPHSMEAARRAGPRSVHTQRRLVSVDDYAQALLAHPLVCRATVTAVWNGAWHCIRVVVILWGGHRLQDEVPANLPEEMAHQVFRPDKKPLLFVDVLKQWIETRRMVGQEVRFEDPRRIGIALALKARVASQYYPSEVLRALKEAFGNQEDGFFAVERQRFGTDLYIGNVMQAAMQVEGVESLTIQTFQRVDAPLRDAVDTCISIGSLEVAVCDNQPEQPQYGALSITCEGGLVG